MYKSEYVLGLIGSIILTAVSALTYAGCLIVALFVGPFKSMLLGIMNRISDGLPFDLAAFASNISVIIIVAARVWCVFSAGAFILGYVGAAKLNKDDKNGGVLLIVAGVLSFFTFFGLIPFVLMLIGGIMALSKKQPAHP
jgi:hypothetical protein